jgi:hypothetical protein
MLAELDDGTPAAPCLDYAQRMRSAGNPNVRVAVYHAYEATGGVGWLPDDETGRACTGPLLLDGARTCSTVAAAASSRRPRADGSTSWRPAPSAATPSAATSA